MSRKLTIAECCLKYGVGAFNIDACRVGSEEISVHNAPKGTFAGGDLERGSDTESYRFHTGRFPSSIILSHTADCELLGHEEEELVSNGYASGMKDGKSENGVLGKFNENHQATKSTSQVAKWNCSPKCPCKLLDEQAPNTGGGHWAKTKVTGYGKFGGGKSEYFGQGEKDGLGGASRFFKQF